MLNRLHMELKPVFALSAVTWGHMCHTLPLLCMAKCRYLKPNRLWNVTLSNSENHNSADLFDTDTFLPSARSHQLFPSILNKDQQHALQNPVLPIIIIFNQASALQFAWSMNVCTYMCVSCSVIRDVFIKIAAVPALNSQCFFVPVSHVSWLAHIIAPKFSRQWLANIWLKGNEPHPIQQSTSHYSLAVLPSIFFVFFLFET